MHNMLGPVGRFSKLRRERDEHADSPMHRRRTPNRPPVRRLEAEHRRRPAAPSERPDSRERPEGAEAVDERHGCERRRRRRFAAFAVRGGGGSLGSLDVLQLVSDVGYNV
jgi:hypothetical protein